MPDRVNLSKAISRRRLKNMPANPVTLDGLQEILQFSVIIWLVITFFCTIPMRMKMTIVTEKELVFLAQVKINLGASICL